MILEKVVKKENIYKEYLRLVNGITKLTDKELEIVDCLLKINDLDDNILSTENRKKVQQECKANELNLNNHISNLKKKLIIKEQEGILVLNDNIIPDYVNGDILVVYRLKIV